MGSEMCIRDRNKEAEMLLKGLGFDQGEINLPYNEFSGGWKMRVEIAKLLIQKPDILLLDEPTNHLDIESIQWLERYLKNYSGIILLISHDRQFLDKFFTVNAILPDGIGSGKENFMPPVSKESISISSSLSNFFISD